MRFSVCLWLCLAGVLVGSSAQAQEAAPRSSAARRDPTAPSAEILRRLAAAAPGIDAMLSSPGDPAADEIVEVVPAFPEPILKGIVMSDPDHGTALLETGGRRVVVLLSRGVSRLSGFSVQGIEFQVLDFSDRSLLLQAPDRTLLVQ